MSALTNSGVHQALISPFTKVMKNAALAYWTIGIVMMVVSWFFWPSPAVALTGAVLLPVALRVGLPTLGVANDNKGGIFRSVFRCIKINLLL